MTKVLLIKGDVLQTRNGRLLIGEPGGGCCPCGEPPADCTCVGSSLPSSLAVGGSFSSCGCTAGFDLGDGYNYEEWDQSLVQSDPAFRCTGYSGKLTPPFNRFMLNGNMPLALPSIYTLRGEPYFRPCDWRFELYCVNNSTGAIADIWSGEKTGVTSDPRGTYVRTSGCDTTPTRVIS